MVWKCPVKCQVNAKGSKRGGRKIIIIIVIKVFFFCYQPLPCTPFSRSVCGWIATGLQKLEAKKRIIDSGVRVVLLVRRCEAMAEMMCCKAYYARVGSLYPSDKARQVNVKVWWHWCVRARVCVWSVCELDAVHLLLVASKYTNSIPYSTKLRAN